MRFALCIMCLSLLMGCNSESSDSSEPVDTVESSDAMAGNWERPCSPVDDIGTAEIFSDADLLPLWWTERLEIDSEGFSVIRNVYIDDACSTPLTITDDKPVIVACHGTERETRVVQNTYEVTSFIYIDSSGAPESQDSCDLPSEPALNVYPNGEVLYRAYYTDSPFGESPTLAVDFNKTFERAN